MEEALQHVDSDPVLVSMAVPKAETLYCFTASIDPSDAKDPSARSDFHWQTFKCRLLVFTAPVLACPVRAVAGPLRDLMVVCLREDFEAQVCGRLAALHLEPGPTRALTDTEYASCLEYTLEAKLAPTWCPLGGRLVLGRDFLTRGAPVDSVRLQVNVKGEQGTAWISLACCRLRLARLTYSDLDVSLPALQRFEDDPLGTVSETCIGQPWVHVLPSLKKGIVVGISKTLPEETPFSRYKDLRRHWKNMASIQQSMWKGSGSSCSSSGPPGKTHSSTNRRNKGFFSHPPSQDYGYRLSEEQTDVYCSVYFRLLGGVAMTYPWQCVTPRLPAGLRCLDPQAVVLGFLSDVALRAPTVCGRAAPVAMDGMARFTATLSCASAAEDGVVAEWDGVGEPPAAAGRRPAAHANLRPLALGENTSPPRTPTTTHRDQDDAESLPATCPLSLASQRDGTRPNMDWHFLKRAPRGSENKENNPPEPDGATAGSSSSSSARAAVVPVFRSRTPVRAPRREPVSVPRATWFQPSACSSPERPASTPATASSTASSAEPSRSSPSTTPTASSSLASEQASAAAAPIVPVFRVPANKPIFLARPQAPPSKPRPRPNKVQGKVAVGKASGGGLGAQVVVGPRGTLPQVLSARSSPKAGASSSPGGGPRGSKRSAADSLPVPDFTSDDAVRRASVAMLLTWLRYKGVPCRSKDKKGDLVDKVLGKLAELRRS
ncbi:hypothetical protein KUF71_013624 [Frankliniella fusca]|uniref:DUF4708 domain-containing protein n=1 Tax=Frankliniella fusca TaxID=407009 RepID=A0AAE1LPC9_9NEOP|nr:hypothetical protein KUF71_013624 [Frankliniella fusca]